MTKRNILMMMGVVFSKTNGQKYLQCHIISIIICLLIFCIVNISDHFFLEKYSSHHHQYISFCHQMLYICYKILYHDVKSEEILICGG